MQNGDTPHVDAQTDVSGQPGSITNGHAPSIASESPAPDGNFPQPPATPSQSDGHRDASTGARGRKRKHSETQSVPRPKKESPPWKKFGVDGAASFINKDGRRVSSRTNALPLDLTPASDKRATRRESGRTSQRKNYTDELSSSAPADQSPVSTRGRGRGKPNVAPATTSRGRGSTRGRGRGAGSQMRGYRRRNAIGGHGLGSGSEEPSPERSRPRPAARVGRPPGRPPSNRTVDHQSERVAAASSRPRPGYRYGPRPLPFVHPANLSVKKKYDTLEELLAKEDFLEGDEIPRPSEAQLAEEAAARQRMIDAAKPGGSLASATFLDFENDSLDEPFPGYSQTDHLCKHIVDFQSRLLRENRDHKALAKKISTIAAAAARSRMPKSMEELEQEQRARFQEVFRRLCMKELKHNFDLTITRVWATKKEEFDEREAAAGRDRMKRMVDRSEDLLTGRTGRRLTAADDDGSSLLDSELDQEQSGYSEAGTDASTSRESTDEDSDDSDSEESGAHDPDDSLTSEQLYSKYKDMPELPDEDMETGTERDSEEEEDEQLSVADPVDHIGGIDPSQHTLEDVDDVLLEDSDDSSGDDDSDEDSTEDSEDPDDSNAEAESDAEDDDEATSSARLMGFFSKSERQQLEQQAEVEKEAHTEQQVDPDPDVAASQDDDPKEVGADAVMVDPSAPVTAEVMMTEHGHAQNASDDPSRQSTPNTSKASRPESMSSVEPTSGDKLSLLQTHAEAEEAERMSVSPLIRGTLRPYQHAGFDWLARMYSESTNGILADEMGLGKTFQTISLLAHLATHHQVWGPHLVVVPTSVMLNWELEFKKFCPGFKILTYYGTQEERKQKRKGWMDQDKWHVCITSYQLALQDAQPLKRRNWHYLILDEAHNIKNFRSQRWQTLLSFKSEARLLLTGTPLQNNLSELWSLLFFLTPEYDEEGNTGFGSLQEFSKVFHKPVDQILEHGRGVLDDESLGIVTKLHQVLRPHLLRRLKADVEKQMPKKYEHVTVCRLSKRQRQLYDSYMALAGTRESFASGNYLSIINCLMQLRKVCNHPDLFDTRQIVTSYAMTKSAVADFEIKELLVRKRLLGAQDLNSEQSLDSVNLWAGNDHSAAVIGRWRHNAVPIFDALIHELQQEQSGKDAHDMIASGLDSLLSDVRSERIDFFEKQRALTAERCQKRPIFDTGLIDLLTNSRRRQPPARTLARPDKQEPAPMTAEAYFEPLIDQLKCSLPARAEAMRPLVQRFGCITPAVVAPNMARFALTDAGVSLIQELNEPSMPDPYQEARTRLSIAFPDKSLIQYDCGKLQQLDKLLRKLQSGGHRALIFTQMTKVLDILEQFMNLHGHRYLRLDGSTKIEQRQVLTDRFNNDPRILCFILSSRSGGLGINLTGADSVIFYDLDWNPAMDKQCQDRCHRIGQTRDVHIYRFVSEGTIEANILRKSNQKRMLDDVVIQEGDFTTEYLDKMGFDEADTDASTALDKVFGGSMGNDRVLQQAEDKEDQDAARAAQKEDVQTDAADFDEKPSLLPAPLKPADSIDIKPSTPQPATPLAETAETNKTTEHQDAAPTEPARPPRPSHALNPEERTSLIEAFAAQPLPQDKPLLRWKRDAAGALLLDEAGNPAELPGYDEYLLRLFEWELAGVAYAPPRDAKKGKKKGRTAAWGQIRR